MLQLPATPSQRRRGRLFQQRHETRLLEVVVGGQGFGDAMLLHHDERDAVRQGPIFVGALGKES